MSGLVGGCKGRYRRRGGLGTCDVWNGTRGRGGNLAPIPKCHGKVWNNSPDCGTRASVDRERWLLLPTGLWLVAVVSWRPLNGCLGGAAGRNATAHAERANNAPPERWPWAFKCRGGIGHTSVVPTCAIPNFACSESPEGAPGYCMCAQAAGSTKRRKKMGSSVAYKTIGTFLSKRETRRCPWVAH